jgi:hypothetical protein
MLNTFGLKTKLRRDKKYNYQECAIKFGTLINYATVSSHKLVHRSSPLDHKQKKGLCAAYNNIELTLAF